MEVSKLHFHSLYVSLVEIKEEITSLINKEYKLNFSKRDNFLGFGWSHNFTGKGVWSEGDLSFILFNLDNPQKNDLKMILNLEPYQRNNNENFILKIYFNNILKSTVNLFNNNDIKNLTLDLNYKEIKKENVVVFKFDNLISPLDLFESPDARSLGVLLKSIKIVKKQK